MGKGPERRQWSCNVGNCGRVLDAVGKRLEPQVYQHLLFTHGISYGGELDQFVPPNETPVEEPGPAPGPEAEPTATAAQAAVTQPADRTAAPPDDHVTVGQLVETEQRLSSQIDALTDGHGAGLCTDDHCVRCQRDRAMLGQEIAQATRFDVYREIDEAAQTFGLGPVRDIITGAIQQLRELKAGRAEAPASDTITVTPG